MKIALLGDLQYKVEEDLSPAMEQIHALQPDWAVSMGDMGCRGEIGTGKGMEACHRLLMKLGCPVTALLGNHDVEYRPDDATLFRRPEAWYADVFGRAKPWQALEAEGWLVLCISVERQPLKGLMTQHALYVSDEQYGWVCDQLEAHRGWPTVLVSHAPVAGSGLRCVPSIHSRATDAFLEEGFQPVRWRRLMQDWPQIRLWCSAHFHMGHDYETALSLAEGVVHASCGVMTSITRDGSRHTRLLEVERDEVRILTLDHETEQIHQDAVVHADGQLSGQVAKRPRNRFLLGEERPCALWHCAEHARAYAATEEGSLWEVDFALQEISGTIVIGQSVRSLACRDGRLYVQGDECFSVAMDDPARFERRSGFVPPARRTEASLPDELLPQVPFSMQQAQEGWYLSWI